MPSHSSCDCAHSCMDLSQALAQVQILQSHCFHKNRADTKRREERRTDGKTDSGQPHSFDVSSARLAMRCFRHLCLSVLLHAVPYGVTS